MEMDDILEKLLTDPDSLVTLIESYKPLLYKFAGVAFGVYKDYVDNEEYHDYTAKALMNKYQALVKYGFTKEQAFALLLDSKIGNDEAMRRFSANMNTKNNK